MEIEDKVRLLTAVSSHRGHWEVGFLLTNETQRVVVIAERNSGTLLAYDITSEALRGSFDNAVCNSIQKHLYVPAKISIRNEEHREMLEPIARMFCICLEVEETLPAVDLAANELRFQLSGELPQ